MKREFNRGGRPALSAAQRQKYIVSTRLDTPLYLQLKSLARQSGKLTEYQRMVRHNEVAALLYGLVHNLACNVQTQ